MLATAEFGGYAKTKLVLMEVDFPQKRKQSAALKKANQDLQAQFKVESFPTVYLFDSEGKKLGEVDSDADGPKTFISAIEKIKGK